MFKLSRSERTVPPHQEDASSKRYDGLWQAEVFVVEAGDANHHGGGGAAWRGGGWGGGLIKR